MNRDALKILLQYGLFITFTALFLLFFVPAGSATFIVTLMSLCVGLLLLALAIFLIRRG